MNQWNSAADISDTGGDKDNKELSESAIKINERRKKGSVVCGELI